MVTTRPLSRSLCCPLSRALVWLTDAAAEFASLLVDPAGADNSVLYTAKEAGAGGEAISIAYVTFLQATTTVAVNTNAITVTPGTKARMVIGGTLTSDGSTPVIFPTLILAGFEYDRPQYSSTGSLAGGPWRLVPQYNGTSRWWSLTDPADNLFESAPTNDLYPDTATGWTAASPATGTPTVTAGVSNAAQVIAAVNAYSPAAALVTASAVGTVTGSVAAVAAANLAR